MVSRSCGDQSKSTTNILHSELDYSTGNIFVVFIFRRGLLLILLISTELILALLIFLWGLALELLGLINF